MNYSDIFIATLFSRSHSAQIQPAAGNWHSCLLDIRQQHDAVLSLNQKSGLKNVIHAGKKQPPRNVWCFGLQESNNLIWIHKKLSMVTRTSAKFWHRICQWGQTAKMQVSSECKKCANNSICRFHIISIRQKYYFPSVFSSSRRSHIVHFFSLSQWRAEKVWLMM